MFSFKKTLMTTLVFCFIQSAQASLVTVSELSAFQPTLMDTWLYGDMRDGGTADIVSLNGLGGDLENNSPLGNDALKLTTGLANNDKAEIVIQNDFGMVSDILNSTLSFSYDYYRTNIDNGNAFAAPSLKLGFYNSNCLQGEDCYFQLIYEPYFNAMLADSQWTNISINLNLGDFWNTGGFGLASGGGGCGVVGCITLDETKNVANANFSSSHLVNVALGIGSYNQGVVGYVDNVNINVGQFSQTYDFENVEVPEPSSIVLFGLSIIGLVGRKFRK
ncbi:PEP-CTERM sorting domain-containing protein [Colwellia sp. 1_MG-2023]|uniref:PEP-CTERM sorting domain-containing protein n=1 Tax=Colwellia sp. 1_MG-2023 TaxID=3062649 RepID=UPI0026E23D2D|nr:PEP-CTERM sorting domain-containing protein [Colwellia sp. 1_MG-2023]MDO6445932.1 PEP-CTERM sorting domain-containing protein [Colwellia sp. 1_MG-2023]